MLTSLLPPINKMEVHVVSKGNNWEHAVATLDDHEYEKHSLPPSCVRVRPVLTSLTSNNLSYARGGEVLHWWDTYPVPIQVSPPYNDQKSWGIVPTWGFAIVTESTLGIAPGTVLWGFWPTADIAVSLKLQPSEPKGHWTEISEPRQRLMTVYNAYSEEGHISLPISTPKTISSLFSEEALQRMAWESLFRPTWQTGYLLSRHTFTSSPGTQPPVHPLGIGLPWTAEDADLSAAVVISLSASSKTGRSFAYHMFQRRAAEGPLGLLQVSQTPSLLEPVAGKLGASILSKCVTYDQSSKSIEWITQLKPTRIVLVDFGARAGTLNQLLSSIKSHAALGQLKLAIIQVGSEQKVYSTDELKRNRELMETMGKIQFNTSAVRDAAVQLEGAQEYYSCVNPVWEKWVGISHEIAPDIHVTLGRGISGNEGIEKGWSRLCQGSVSSREGLVYLM
ncbi:hypothetical protein ETB97_006008 [Aspergillus alliaceus]|uniref:Uncharacterized protein n=1 Tax=Petromyces alliaceus TaxID=209559 RepID=A0A8H6E3N7_PETAA|nr:hypothetical protein ETB97_006008 [Aspergillus burnettii]